uniref:TTF-type domain-containing protein n=1 Tax=Leptobrachium leishanense TaxID=445787 RepID=A0A8C5QKG7_9ANUR
MRRRQGSIHTFQPEGDSVSQPEGDSVSQPEGDSVSQPEGDSVSQPEGDSVSQPEGDSSSQPEGDSVSHPKTSSSASRLQPACLPVPVCSVHPNCVEEDRSTAVKPAQLHSLKLSPHLHCLSRANSAASCSLPHNSTTITTKRKNDGDAGKTSKKRRFNTHWLEQFSWLIFSEDTDTVTCKVCSRFPQTSDAKWKDGVKAPFKNETFVWHEKSNKHKENVDKVKAKDTPEERPLAVCIKKMDAAMFQHMTHMFIVAYYVAKSEKPFRDYMDLLTLAAKLDVPILQKYGNDVQCKQFIHFIAKIIRESLVANIKKSTFVGIMIDGSTDRTSTEHANVYVRYVSEGNIKEDFLGTFALESATAQGYLKGLTAFLDILHLDYRGTPWVAGLGTDGAASMLGHKSGLAVQMKDICPQIISIHCVAHRLQLAVLDVCKEVPYLQTFDDVVRRVFKYYHGSAKRLQQLKEVAKSLSEEILKLRDIHTVRWLCSKVDALRAFLQNWKTVVTHFEQISTEGTTDSAKVKGILKDLKQLKFVKLLHFLLDFYSKLKPLSEGLQNKELMICHLKNKLEHAVKTLQDLCKGRGKNELEFVSKLTGNGTLYGLQLTNLQAGEREFNSIRQSVLAKAEKYLILRLSSVSSDIVKSFNIFDSLSWPDKAQILSFGLNELHTIAKHVFNDQFEDKVDILDVEWADMKLSIQSGLSFNEALKKLNQQKERFPTILPLVNFCAVLPPTTASCERGFSYQNRIKTVYRSSLAIETLDDLLMIAVNGPPLPDYNPNTAIDKWYFSSERDDTQGLVLLYNTHFSKSLKLASYCYARYRKEKYYLKKQEKFFLTRND